MAISITSVLKHGKRGTMTLVIPSTSVIGAKNGIRTTQVHNAKESVHACGALGTIFIGNALIFKGKAEKMQNVQTAMKHILPGPRAAQFSLRPPKPHQRYLLRR